MPIRIIKEEKGPGGHKSYEFEVVDLKDDTSRPTPIRVKDEKEKG